MQLPSLAAFRVVYAVAVAGMAAWILYSSSPGAVVSRSYAAYNNRAINETSDITYMEVNLPWMNTFERVTAEEARNIKDGVVVFAYPTCPFCRNLFPELAKVAKEENLKIYYCKLNDYRDKYAFNPNTNQPEKVIEEKEGYKELLNWLNDLLEDYTVKDKNGNEIAVGEKRITAPTIVAVKDNKPISTWDLSRVSGVREASETNGAYAPWDEELQTEIIDALTQYFAS